MPEVIGFILFRCKEPNHSNSLKYTVKEDWGRWYADLRDGQRRPI